MTRFTARGFACVTFAVAMTGSIASADHIYFAEIAPDFTNGFVSRVNVDGQGLVQLVTTGPGVRAVAFDPVDRKVYWTDVDNYVIARANADGQGAENVVTSGLVFPSAIVIEPTTRKMYWIDQDVSMSRANLDGSNLQILNATVTYRGIDLDRSNGKVYWSISSTAATGKIRRSNFDGTDSEIAVQSGDAFFRPGAVAVDGAGGKIYWSDQVVDVIRRSNLDGSGIEIVWNGDEQVSPRGIALDLRGGKIYWGRDFTTDTGSEGSIWRADLDGSNPEPVIFGVGLVNYLVFVPSCSADFNGDSTVDFFDYLDFVQEFSRGTSQADFNRDGVVDFFDYLDFVLAFSAGC